MNADNMIEFVTDPLRLTLIVAGIVVIFAILILGRRAKYREVSYKGRTEKNYSFGTPPADTLVDEEVIVLPRRKKESELLAEEAPQFSANYDEKMAKKDTFSAEKIKESRASVSRETNVATAKMREENQSKTSRIDDAINSLYAKPPVIISEKSSEPEYTTKVVEAPVKNTIERALETAPEQLGEKISAFDDVQEEPKLVKSTSQVQQQFVVLHIIAEEGQTFVGKAIFDATQTLGMALGKHNVFHYPADAAYVGDSAFCLVNMTPEGTFDIENLAGSYTTGISLILTLPTAYSDGLTVFSNMVAVAHALVKKLGGGDIVDQTRLPLTAELLASMQADISKFESQLKEQVEAPVY